MPDIKYLSAHEAASASRVVEAAIHNADRQADLVASELKRLGYKPSAAKSDTTVDEAAKSELARRADRMLLHLGAMLQLAEWKRAGLQSHLPASLSTSINVSPDAVPPWDAEGGDAQHTPLVTAVLQTWLERFVRASPMTLGVDIAFQPEAIDEDALLDELADFLWEHRHLATSAGEDE